MRFLLLFSLCFGTEMSLEEKVGQLLMVQFYGETANEEAKELICDLRVGGIIYYNFANGLTSPDQVRSLSFSLQHLASQNRLAIPLLIATDQEGGRVARLRFTPFPGHGALGKTGDLLLAKETAFLMGKELLDVGINMNLAPVVDLNTNPKNQIIGDRSFGNDPATVTAFGRQFVDGLHRAHVIATLKHFPGHGDVTIDSHEDLPLLSQSLQELTEVELFPFAHLASSADAIMTAHILAPALDPDHCSTLSKKSLAYLRETLGFRGVIVTDSLVMEGVLKECGSVDEAAIRALDAGCDLLLLGGKLLIGTKAGFELTTADIKRIHAAIVAAVKTGRLLEEKLDQSVSRILALKGQIPPHSFGATAITR